MQKAISRSIALVALICLSIVFAGAQSYTLEKTAVAGGGMSSGAGGVFTLGSTTGQTAAGNVRRGGTFAMTVGFWSFTPLAPTAAEVSISGRVLTSSGQGIRSARMVLTDAAGVVREATTGSFGYFQFNGVRAGETYVLTVYSRRFVFAEPARVINLSDDLAEVNFTSEP